MDTPRFTTLFSGSSGNAALVGGDGRYLLIDAGASCRQLLAAAERVGVSRGQFCGVLITHEHTDHIKGLNVFLKQVPVPVFSTPATLDYLWQADVLPAGADLHPLDSDSTGYAGFSITNFATSHDAAGSCGFRIEVENRAAMAITTDLGVMEEHVFRHLQNASLVALEANYDREMLRLGPYPAYLKKRIASHRGHLSNDDSAAAVVALMAGGCRNVVLCHLSEENNHPDRVLQTVREAFARSGREIEPGCSVRVAARYEPGEWVEF